MQTLQRDGTLNFYVFGAAELPWMKLEFNLYK
jgi:hypothetical protein